MIRHTLAAAVLGAGVLFGGANTAEAATVSVGYELKLGKNFNFPTMRLTNTSTSDVEISEFKVSIGDTNYNFDLSEIRPSSDGVNGSLVTPDDGQNGLRSDEVHYTVSGLEAGKYFRFRSDIDIDSQNSREDYRTILFDENGPDYNDNAEIDVWFSDGSHMNGYLADYSSNDGPYFYYGQSEIRTVATAIPLPPAIWGGISMLGGLGGISGIRRIFRRR